MVFSVGLLIYSFWGMIGDTDEREKKVSSKSQLFGVSPQLIKTIERRISVANNNFRESIRARRSQVQERELEVTYYYVIKRSPF